MSKQHLPLTPAQRFDLLAAVRLRRNSWATYAPYLDLIHETLRHAELVPADDWGARATIGSVVHVRRPDAIGAERVTLVLPQGEDAGHVSVLEPLGWELLGARSGDVVQAVGPEGLDTYVVERVARPVRQGDRQVAPAHAPA